MGAQAGQRLRITYEAAATIGHGNRPRDSNTQKMQKVILILERTSRNGKIYFLLTAYPVP